MMDTRYTEQIKKLKGFEQLKYLDDIVMKDLTFPYQLSDFITDIVRKSTKEGNWQVALRVAETIDDKGVWATLTNLLKLLAHRPKKPSWLPQYLDRYAKKVDIDNYVLKDVFTVFIRAEMVTTYLNYIKPKYPNEDTYRAVRDVLLQITPGTLKQLIKVFNDWKFINEIYYGKLSDNMENIMLTTALRQVDTMGLENFDSFDLEWLMKNHPEPFKDVNVINSAIASFKVKHSNDATTRLTKFIMEGPFKDDSKLPWLWSMYDVEGIDKNEAINAALYELTGKEEYLADEAKDIFLF